jgi:hypothetical protein
MNLNTVFCPREACFDKHKRGLATSCGMTANGNGVNVEAAGTRFRIGVAPCSTACAPANRW